MASCGLGASGLKITNLELGCVRPKLGKLQPLHCLNSKSVGFDGLRLSNRSRNPVIRCLASGTDGKFIRNPVIRCSASGTDAIANLEDNYETAKSSDEVSQLIPNSFEVESLLTVLCDTTSIAEFELKLGGFRLYVARDLAGQSDPPHPPVSAPVTAHSVVETPNTNGSASSPSLALSKPVPSSYGVQTLLDKAADEGLVILQSPRVGYFRRSRTIKGKKAPPSCKEKDIVKEGQVLCYIDQLGGEIPIESDISGEVVKILIKDGDPVGYGDALISVLPSFPGIKKLQ